MNSGLVTGLPTRVADRLARNSTRRSAAALALILTVAFMVVLDFSIVNVALASIERELHAGATDVQWVITAYAITFGGLLVLGGRIGDLWGRRRVFIVGLVVFSLASLMGGFATSIGALVAARAVQGIGAAVVAPAALSLITTTTPEGPARTRALGFYGATASVGFVAGLVLGGVLVQFFDWRAVLWVNVPIGLLAAGVAPLLISEARSPRRGVRLDVRGAVLATGAVAALVYGVSQGPAAGWLSDRTLGGLGLALVLASMFVVVEQRHPAPLVRLGIFRRRMLRSANLMAILLGAWSAGELLTIPLYFQLVLHYSPLVTGFAMAPQGVIGFIGATRGARLVHRVGARAFLAGSGAAAMLGLLLLGLTVSSHDYAFLVVGFMLAGYGTATAAFGTTVAATQGVSNAEQGLAGGLINMSRQVGAAIGVAVTAAIIGTGVASGDSIGHDSASLVLLAAAALVAVLVVLRGIGPAGERRADDRHPARVAALASVETSGLATAETSATGASAAGPSAHQPRAVTRGSRLGLRLRRAPLCRVNGTADDGPSHRPAGSGLSGAGGHTEPLRLPLR